MRAVLEATGVRDILTKSLGSANVLNVAQATLKGLRDLKSYKHEATRRGKDSSALQPFWERESHG